jgi:hypothetical protein
VDHADFPARRSCSGWRRTLAATDVELTDDDLREIHAASAIVVQGDRYAAAQQQMIDR